MITYNRRSAFRKLTQQVLEGFNTYDAHRGDDSLAERRSKFIVQVRLRAMAYLLNEERPFSGDPDGIEAWFDQVITDTIMAQEYQLDPEEQFGLLSNPLYFDASARRPSSVGPAKGHLSR